MYLVLITVVWSALASATQAKSSRRETKQLQQQKPPAPIMPATLKESHDGNSAADQKITYEGGDQPQSVRVTALPPRDWIDDAALVINGLLAAVGLGGLAIAVLTSRKVGRQTDATERAVEATEKAVLATQRTTQAYVNVERPFIEVVAEGDADSVTFTAFNKGRTPAQILYINPMLDWDVVDFGNTLPSEPNYTGWNEQAEAFNLTWIFPDNKGYLIGSFQTRSHYSNCPEREVSLRSFASSLFIYSAIRYRGTLGENTYITRFCYKLALAKFILSGPYGYNQNT